jgi:hypothetical protein
MKPSERNEKLWEIFQSCMDLVNAKGHDYAGDEDCLANLKRFGFFGVVVRLSDKFSRLEQFANSGELYVKGESVEDTLKDIINYAALGLVLYAEEKKK